MVSKRRTNHRTRRAVDRNILEYVDEFVYLGSLITNRNDCSAEMSRRINVASQRMRMLKTLWSSSELTVKTELDVMVLCVFSRLLYVAGTWTIEVADSRKPLAFETSCYRRILKVCWKDRVSNKIVREKVQRHCTTYNSRLNKAKKVQTVWAYLQDV